MSGTATLGKDYTLIGTSGQAVIAAGARSSNITLNALANSSSTGNLVATMTLGAGAGYTLSSSSTASITIQNALALTPTPTSTPSLTPNPTPTPLPRAPSLEV